MLDSSLTTGRSRMLLLFLFAAAIAGNYFRFPLVFGLDFLFGSIAVLVVVYCYGIRWGVLCAIVAGLYTLVLWHHPYALIIFTVEALFVGLAMRRTSNMLLLDGIYWLLLGMPLVWLLYFHVLHTESTQTWLVMLKDAVNGIFNALIASLIVTHTPLRVWPSHTRREPLVPISQAVFNICVGCVLLPTLLLLFTHSQETLRGVEQHIQNDLQSQTRETVGTFEVWRQRRFGAVHLIGEIATTQLGPSPALQKDTALIARSLPDCTAIFVSTTKQQALASYARGARGARLRPFLQWQAGQILRKKRKAGLIAHWSAKQPFAVIAVPIPARATTPGKPPAHGVAVAAFDMAYARNFISPGLPSETMSSSVLDASRNVVASVGNRNVGSYFPPRRGQGRVRRFASGIYHWLPPANRPAVELWRSSVFVRETPLRGTPWILALEAPLQRHHNLLNQTYYSNLLLVLILLVATLLLASVLSRALTLPLSRLAQETTGLPSRILRGDESQSFLQPRNPLYEIETLISNFQAMAGTLQQNFAELRGTQRQLEIEQQRLTEANRLKDEFLAILSHELRTPLVPIIGYADLIARGVLKDEERDEGARSIERNARAQLRLIEDLLDVSRIITGKLSLQVGKVNLSQVMRDSIETVSLSARNKGITLTYDERDHIAPILGDEARVRQVVWNLLSNAVKFTPHDGRVDVALRRVDEEAEITVADSGHGIAPDFLPHVFDRFRQGSDHLTRSAGGLGLGLAIVQHLVELHGGTVTAHSAGENQGTTFRVRLPVRSHPDAPQDKPSLQTTSKSSSTNPDAHHALERHRHAEKTASTQQVPTPAAEHTSNGTFTPAEHDAPETSALSRTASADTASPQRATRRNTLVMRHRLPGAKVLVIDDEADGREMLMATLRLEGAAVRGAGSAREALQLTQQETPDAIVCDIGMPEMDGFEFLRNLRAESRFERVPVIAFTAYASKKDRDDMLSSGFDAYLSKPAMSDEVIDVLERMVERH